MVEVAATVWGIREADIRCSLPRAERGITRVLLAPMVISRAGFLADWAARGVAVARSRPRRCRRRPEVILVGRWAERFGEVMELRVGRCDP